MSAFGSVLASGCSAHARFLLCSAFAPLCSEAVSGAVSACRALCEVVARDCADGLQALNLTGALDCALFPLRADTRLCMRPPNASEPDPAPPRAAPPAPLPAACPPGLARSPTGDCRAACMGDPRRASTYARNVDLWATVLAWVALGSTLFALVTFLADPSRYRYPERPWVWAAACHALVAGAWAVRGWTGPAAACGAGGVVAADALAAPACLAHFVTTYYFTLAAEAWFAGACAAWYLTACGEWSTEALERVAAYVHAGAWGWAGAWTAAALALRRVSAGGALGACGVSARSAAALEGVPRGAALLAALALGGAAAGGVARVRRALDAAGARRVLRVGARAAVAGGVYWVLAAGGLAARLVEARATLLAASGAWPGAGLDSAAPSGLAVCVSLAGGAAAGAWAWSRKSTAVWARAVCKAPAPPPLLPHHPHPLPYHKRPLHVSRV